MALRFTNHCKKLGLAIHGDFIVGLPSATRDTIQRTIDFAKRLDTETIQVSIAHALPGTELHAYGMQNGLINLSMADESGHQLPKSPILSSTKRNSLMPSSVSTASTISGRALCGGPCARLSSIPSTVEGSLRKHANICHCVPSASSSCAISVTRSADGRHELAWPTKRAGIGSSWTGKRECYKASTTL